MQVMAYFPVLYVNNIARRDKGDDPNQGEDINE